MQSCCSSLQRESMHAKDGDSVDSSFLTRKSSRVVIVERHSWCSPQHPVPGPYALGSHAFFSKMQWCVGVTDGGRDGRTLHKQSCPSTSTYSNSVSSYPGHKLGSNDQVDGAGVGSSRSKMFQIASVAAGREIKTMKTANTMI